MKRQTMASRRIAPEVFGLFLLVAARTTFSASAAGTGHSAFLNTPSLGGVDTVLSLSRGGGAAALIRSQSRRSNSSKYPHPNKPYQPTPPWASSSTRRASTALSNPSPEHQQQYSAQSQSIGFASSSSYQQQQQRQFSFSSRSLSSSVAAASASTREFVQKNAATLCVSLVVAVIAGVFKDYWTPFFSKDAIQATTIAQLSRLRPSPEVLAIQGPSALYKALGMYAMGMAVWECLGLSTIPVETAAAMVFGWQAWAPSALGKLLGATVAFGLGRTALSQPAQRRLLSSSESTSDDDSSSTTKVNIWKELMTPPTDQQPPAHHPLATALFIKFSCFPELVKNVGSGLVAPLRAWHFVVATMIHGWAFTTLWTAFGVDAAARMAVTAAAVAPTNIALTIMMGLTLAVGFVGSPLLMAWWMRDVKRHALQHQQPELLKNK